MRTFIEEQSNILSFALLHHLLTHVNANKSQTPDTRQTGDSLPTDYKCRHLFTLK
uniref:Uncharacterized protein n=1 Tax=Arion vulgaris TaxID=1028688 RepID=A0A0B7BUY8_9EUPU